MALIKCKECNSQVSDKAKHCPKCGYQNKRPFVCLECGERIASLNDRCDKCGYNNSVSKYLLNIIKNKYFIMTLFVALIIFSSFSLFKYIKGQTIKIDVVGVWQTEGMIVPKRLTLNEDNTGLYEESAFGIVNYKKNDLTYKLWDNEIKFGNFTFIYTKETDTLTNKNNNDVFYRQQTKKPGI